MHIGIKGWVGALLVAGAILPASSSAQVFRSPQTANLPTAETLEKGWVVFEISHRFLPPVSDGADALWGFDGPVQNRLGLSWAASDRVTLGVQRTNYDDNLELNAKARLWEKQSEANAFAVAAMGGLAWNHDAPIGLGADENESQAYGQLLLNGRFGEKVAIGLVPTLLRNPSITSASPETVFVLGGHGQIYLSRSFSLLAEWVKSERRAGAEYDSGTFGIELATRGHFFKIVLTNQTAMNPTQYLGGASNSFDADNWSVGFNLQRRLRF